MASVRVVPALDELEDRELRLGMGAEGAAIDEFAFKRRKEALAHRIIVAITHRAHGGSDTGLLTALSEGDRAVLRTLPP